MSSKIKITDHNSFILFCADPELGLVTPDPGIAYDLPATTARMRDGDGVIKIASVPDIEAFSRDCEAFSYLIQPLKQSGSIVHYIPEAYERFLPVLRLIANYEFSHSPCAIEKKANLIIEKIKPQEDYPVGEWHQHQEGNPDSANHVYTVSDIFTTIVQTKPKPGAEYRNLEPYEIGLMTGYNWHCADVLPKGSERTFLRVVYEAP